MKYSLKKNVPVDIYWFSGSGNSLIIAIEIKDYLTVKGYVVNLLPLDETDPSKVDVNSVIGFAVPVAGQSTYPFIWEFIEKLPETQKTLCFFADSLGMYSGGILGPVKKIIRKKGYIPIGAKEIIMPNIFQKRKSCPEKEMKMIEKGKRSAREFCDRLLSGKGHWNDIPGYSWFLSMMYRYRKPVNFTKKLFPWRIDPDKCIKCGTCVKLCPEKSLSFIEGSTIPVRNSRCTLCHRCFEFCPSDAVYIGRKNALKYNAVSLKELLSNLRMK